MLPVYAVAFSCFTAVFEDAPDFRCFSAQADRDILVEAANHID
jgi:hypothetical protein